MLGVLVLPFSSLPVKKKKNLMDGECDPSKCDDLQQGGYQL